MITNGDDNSKHIPGTIRHVGGDPPSPQQKKYLQGSDDYKAGFNDGLMTVFKTLPVAVHDLEQKAISAGHEALRWRQYFFLMNLTYGALITLCGVLYYIRVH